jgi:hypothetical protein
MKEHPIKGKKKQESEFAAHRDIKPDIMPINQGLLLQDLTSYIGNQIPSNDTMQRHSNLLSTASPDVKMLITRQLQQTYGNRYVQRVFESIKAQAKLTVSAVKDPLELEANRVANTVMEMAAPTIPDKKVMEAEASAGRLVSQDHEEAQVKPMVSQVTPKEANHNPGERFEVADEIQEKIESRKGLGSPLSDEMQSFVETRFGADFSRVRVHNDEKAAGLNRELSARAFTHGNDIYLGEDKNNLDSTEGKRLMAHELTHVLQQNPQTSHIGKETGLSRQYVVKKGSNDGITHSGDLDFKAGTIEGMAPIQGELSREPETGSPSTPGSEETIVPQLGPGHDLSSYEEQASFAVGGLPAFRYNIPNVPVANGHIETPAASIDVALSIIGAISITFAHSTQNVSTDVDQLAFRAEATKAVNGLFTGIRINGLNSNNVSFGSVSGTEFVTYESRLIPPNTMAFRGQVRIVKNGLTPVGPVTLAGQPGFELRVTVTPHLEPMPVREVQPQHQESWFAEHEDEIAAITGLVLLGAAIILLAPETFGGSLALAGAAAL